MRKTMIAMVVTGLLGITACGGEEAASKPIVKVGDEGNKGKIVTLQLQPRLLSTVAGGIGKGNRQSSAQGLKVAYLFEQGQVRTRVDLPASAFPDRQARILLMGGKNPTARLLLAHNMKPDLSAIASQSLESASKAMVAQSSGLLNMLDPAQPFKKLSLDRLSTLARLSSYDLNTNSSGRTILTRTLTQGSLTQRIKLIFDASVGQIVASEIDSKTPDYTSTTISSLSYADVPGTSDVSVPYQIKTTVSAEQSQSIIHHDVTLPTASEHYTGEVKLKPGEVILNSYTAPVGEGKIDLNKRVFESEINFDNLTVNAVSRDFFYLEGRQ